MGGATDGRQPFGGLVGDFASSLYGTTEFGGASDNGVVFKLDPTGKETVLHSFAGPPADGSTPYSGLTRDFAGDLYGTTQIGGASYQGVVFKLDATGKETVLHNFRSLPDGTWPRSSLTLDPSGNLYGTTQSGGTPNFGVVYEVTP